MFVNFTVDGHLLCCDHSPVTEARRQRGQIEFGHGISRLYALAIKEILNSYPRSLHKHLYIKNKDLAVLTVIKKSTKGYCLMGLRKKEQNLKIFIFLACLKSIWTKVMEMA